jgi:hypothetical protein
LFSRVAAARAEAIILGAIDRRQTLACAPKLVNNTAMAMQCGAAWKQAHSACCKLMGSLLPRAAWRNSYSICDRAARRACSASATIRVTTSPACGTSSTRPRSFTGVNDRNVHAAGRRRFLIARSLAVACKRQLALVTMPPFGEIVAQSASGDAIGPVVAAYGVEN